MLADMKFVKKITFQIYILIKAGYHEKAFKKAKEADCRNSPPILD